MNFWKDAKSIAMNGNRSRCKPINTSNSNEDFESLKRFDQICLIGRDDKYRMTKCQVDATWKSTRQAAAGWVTSFGNLKLFLRRRCPILCLITFTC